jgi:hypothetical protein
MKKILLPSLIVLIAIVGMSIVSAFNFGEKSPIYVKGEVRISDALRDSLEGVSTMFVVIYDLDSPMPMPFGAMRERLSAEQLADYLLAIHNHMNFGMQSLPNEPNPCVRHNI